MDEGEFGGEGQGGRAGRSQLDKIINKLWDANTVVGYSFKTKSIYIILICKELACCV